MNDPGGREARLKRLVRAALIVLLVMVSALGLVRLAIVYPPFVDLEIPLRAAERWMAGGDPYLASSFLEPPGYTLPFLYAPPTLPLFAILAPFPRPIVVALWLGACIAAAVFATRRIGIPWGAVAFVLAWPPFAQALLGGNVQIFMFAALVATFWRRADRAWTPVEANTSTTRRPLFTGTLAAFVPAMKISTPHSWVALARLSPRAAAMGAGVAVAIVAVTLPVVGADLWTEWVDQVRRAMDPGWSAGGHRVLPDLPLAITGAAWLVAVLACLIVPRDRAGTWVGLLAVIGAASLHVFVLLFALPALLVIRRELGLLAALMIATGDIVAGGGMLLWGGALLAALALALAPRWPALLDPSQRVEVAPS